VVILVVPVVVIVVEVVVLVAPVSPYTVNNVYMYWTVKNYR
jgi:GDP-D-mannose dehydratase